jgi:hypothetical protein
MTKADSARSIYLKAAPGCYSPAWPVLWASRGTDSCRETPPRFGVIANLVTTDALPCDHPVYDHLGSESLPLGKLAIVYMLHPTAFTREPKCLSERMTPQVYRRTASYRIGSARLIGCSSIDTLRTERSHKIPLPFMNETLAPCLDSVDE